MALGALAAALALAYLAVSAFGAVDDAPSLWRAVAVAGSLLPAAMCLIVPGSRGGPRPAVRRLLALGMISWGAGFAVYFLAYEHNPAPPVPSVVDALWIGFYVLLFAALSIKAGNLMPRSRRLLALNVLAGVLAVGALMAVTLFDPLRDAAGGEVRVVVMGLVYPALDLMLLGLTIAIIAAMGWRLFPRWALILGALLLQIAGDSIYGWQLSHGTWRWGTPLEGLWPIVQLMLAAALLVPSRPRALTREDPQFGLALPLGFTVLTVGLLVYGNFADPPLVALVLTTGALVASAGLLGLNARELRRLRSAVKTDPLTGLVNHHHFHETLATAVAAARDGDGELVLLLGDLDGFKRVNDNLGHACGDEVLRDAARILASSFPDGLVGRLGGDEFGVILPGAGLDSSAATAEHAAQKIETLSEGLGLSWGAATFPTDGPSPQLLLVRADLALYEAKAGVGGSRERQDTQSEDTARLQLEAYARDVRTGYARERRRARDLTESYLATVMALAAAVEAKDDATGGHIHRVHALGLVLAEVVCPDDFDDPQMAHGFLLHDIGKLAVPDAVLSKPGKLDAEEWAIMKSHPAAGVRILSGVPFLGRALDVVAHHHERWDGNGYPDGLAGDAIPLWARIFAVADTVDAMTADRPYRKGLPYETALAEVRAQAGKQFDPTCAAALGSLSADVVLPLLEAHSPEPENPVPA